MDQIITDGEFNLDPVLDHTGSPQFNDHLKLRQPETDFTAYKALLAMVNVFSLPLPSSPHPPPSHTHTHRESCDFILGAWQTANLYYLSQHPVVI